MLADAGVGPPTVPETTEEDQRRKKERERERDCVLEEI